MVVDNPAPTPLTVPFSEPTVAIAGFAEVQVPPATASEKSVELPAQTEDAPVIGEGAGVTVTTCVT